MPETVKKEWRAVKKAAMSAGDGLEGFSANNDCNGVVLEDPRARERVWRKEAKPLLGCGARGGCGDKGRLDEGGILRIRGVEDEVEASFFLLLNGLNRDHSDSN
jgi:hypothetical protein